MKLGLRKNNDKLSIIDFLQIFLKFLQKNFLYCFLYGLIFVIGATLSGFLCGKTFLIIFDTIFGPFSLIFNVIIYAVSIFAMSVFLCYVCKEDIYLKDEYVDVQNEYLNDKHIKHINDLKNKQLETKEEIENEILRLLTYLEKIKKYKKEPAFKTEIKHTEELIETYYKILNK